MVRTLISLDEQDKAWLDRKAEESGRSMSAIVRDAIQRLREAENESLDELLNRTSGTWTEGDALAYLDRARSEWE